MEQNFLTKEGYERLVAELHVLKADALPKILGRLKEAIEQGDISENAEYDTAMNEKEIVESRINEIESLLQNVEIIEEDNKIRHKEVSYGSKVTVRHEGGKTYEITIVGSGEVNILDNTISFDSPLGGALRGKKVGDTVKVRAPMGRADYTIVSIK